VKNMNAKPPNPPRTHQEQQSGLRPIAEPANHTGDIQVMGFADTTKPTLTASTHVPTGNYDKPKKRLIFLRNLVLIDSAWKLFGPCYPESSGEQGED